jgi:hypothetical protein
LKTFELDSIRLPREIRAGEWFEATDDNCTWHHAWDVSAANRFMLQNVMADLSAGRLPRRVVRIPLHPLNLRMLAESGTETDPSYLRSDACDPRRPILTVQLDGRDWIIDGWHRARRAAAMGWRELLAFVLTPAEEKACRICDCCGPRDGVPLRVAGMGLRVSRHLAIALLDGSARQGKQHVIRGEHSR